MLLMITVSVSVRVSVSIRVRVNVSAVVRAGVGVRILGGVGRSRFHHSCVDRDGGRHPLRGRLRLPTSKT